MSHHPQLESQKSTPPSTSHNSPPSPLPAPSATTCLHPQFCPIPISPPQIDSQRCGKVSSLMEQQQMAMAPVKNNWSQQVDLIDMIDHTHTMIGFAIGILLLPLGFALPSVDYKMAPTSKSCKIDTFEDVFIVAWIALSLVMVAVMAGSFVKRHCKKPVDGNATSYPRVYVWVAYFAHIAVLISLALGMCVVFMGIEIKYQKFSCSSQSMKTTVVLTVLVLIVGLVFLIYDSGKQLFSTPDRAPLHS